MAGGGGMADGGAAGYPGEVSTVPAVAWPQPPVRPSRPGRDVLVAARLADLRGPVSGVVELPLHLFWSSLDRSFDLSDPVTLGLMYEKVLCQARSLGELVSYLDGGTLTAVWPGLILPRDVRQAWEARHPGLRRAAA